MHTVLVVVVGCPAVVFSGGVFGTKLNFLHHHSAFEFRNIPSESAGAIPLASEGITLASESTERLCLHPLAVSGYLIFCFTLACLSSRFSKHRVKALMCQYKLFLLTALNKYFFPGIMQLYFLRQLPSEEGRGFSGVYGINRLHSPLP